MIGRSRGAVVVLAKFPQPGRVKTRLAAMVGAEAACALYDAFVRDLAGRLRGAGVPVWWAFTPPASPFASLVRSPRCFPQARGDLGARMHHAVRTVTARVAGPVVVLGADAPHVDLGEVRRALGALRLGADVVLGPARDGGYYLIGLRAPCRAVFADVPWSTRRVAAATRARCRARGLRCLEVATDFDVDGPDDLRTLAAYVARRPRELPRTRTGLAEITRRSGSLPPAASPSSGCARRRS